MHHRSRSYSRAAILGIRIKYWWRWLIQINVHSPAPRSPQSSWALFVSRPSFRRNRRVPFFLSSLLPRRRTKRDPWLPPRTRHGLSSSLICSVSLYIVPSSRSCCVPLTPSLFQPRQPRSTSVMMNGVAGGGIYPRDTASWGNLLA